MLHVLVIGAGTMGKVHSHAYAAMENVKLAGIVDIRADQAGRLASQVGTLPFTSIDEALKTLDRVDVIDVCVPTYLHKQYVLKAADSGKHVICEKPLARNLNDAQEMIRYCKEKNVKLFVGHVIRFFPEYINAKRLLEQNTIGPAAVVRTSRGGPFPAGWNNWYGDFALSGGLTLDLIIHDFDYLRWCFGEVERVYAKGLQGRISAPLDYALVTLRFKNGVIAHVEGSWAHDTFSMKFEMAGKSGIIEYDSAKEQPLAVFSRAEQTGSRGVAIPESPLKENPYYLELKHFLSCIEQDKKPVVTAEDAYEAMRISLAATESMKTGKPVSL